MGNDGKLDALRRAVAAAPDDPTLRLLLADALAEAGLLAEAETEYRAGLAGSPHHRELAIGLARVYVRTARLSAGIVVLEDLLARAGHAADARALLARLLLAAGDPRRAADEYRRAVEADPDVADETLEAQLGIGAGEDEELVDGRLRAGAGQAGTQLDGVTIERPPVTFADVGGMEALKEDIRLKIIHPLAHAELYEAYGKAVGGGILMYGPPGCGKTYLARATAGEVAAGFLAVGLEDVLDMWIGQSERNLHSIFEAARRNAPCVLFFDEVDALAASRIDMRTSAGRHVINQFLNELDGANRSNEGLLVLAATNAPWHVDPAFRRPGRFDRVIFVPPPDASAREEILRAMLRGKPADEVDVRRVAARTDGFSGADLRGIVEAAVERKLGEAIRSGIPAPLSTNDLLAAASAARPTTGEWFATARNYVLYANEGGLYDPVRQYLRM